MKEKLLITTLLFYSFQSQTQVRYKKFHIKVQSQLKKPIKLIYKTSSNNSIIETTKFSKNGVAQFSGLIDEPVLARIIIDTMMEKHFFLEPKKLNLTISINNDKKIKTLLNGSITNQEMEYNEQLLNNITQDSFLIKKFYYDSLFMIKHPSSFYTAFLLNYYVYDVDENISKSIYEMLPPKIKSMPTGISIKEKLQEISGIKSVKKYLNTVLIDTLGERVAVKTIIDQNNYTLLDFWASWCIPCRNNVANLKNLVFQYSQKSFSILSISQDKLMTEWKRAIKMDSSYMFNHLIDIEGDFHKELLINYIPIKVLITNSFEILGIYSGKWIGKMKLQQKLKSLLNE